MCPRIWGSVRPCHFLPFLAKLEQECASLQLKLETVSKRHKREIEDVDSRAQKSASEEFQVVMSNISSTTYKYVEKLTFEQGCIHDDIT